MVLDENYLFYYLLYFYFLIPFSLKVRPMEYEKGTHVSVKDNLELETGELTKNWAGEILEYYPETGNYLIELDAPTLLSLSDTYLMDCIMEGGDYEKYIFESHHLNRITRRDTEKIRADTLKKTRDRINDLIAEMDEEDDYGESPIEEWITGFQKSSFFDALTEYQKENARFIIETFYDFSINYAGVLPEEWDAGSVQHACDIAGRKISDEIELFENYTPVLDKFFEFLGDKQYLENTLELREAAREMAPHIVRIASDPSEWGMAKSMMKGAIESGVDLSDEKAREEYIDRINQQMGPLPAFNPSPSHASIRKSKLDKIGRNERITVRYTDGRVVENIKFKKVKEDLETGKCVLVEK